MSWKLARPVGLCAALTIPALFLRRRAPVPAPGGGGAVPAPGNLPSPRPAGGIEDMSVMASARPVLLPVSGRSLVLVAGIPGTGKSTLMRTLRPDRTLRISDSDPLRSAVMRRLPRGMRYGLVRPLVHLLHRASVVCLALGPATTVVVHLPATSARLRRAVTALARLSRRTACLVWLDVPAAEARDGQRARGRMVTARSFERHARRARQASEQIRGRQLGEGWATTLLLDREAARAGLRIQIGDRPRHHREELVSAGDRSTTARSGLSKDFHRTSPRAALVMPASRGGLSRKRRACGGTGCGLAVPRRSRGQRPSRHTWPSGP